MYSINVSRNTLINNQKLQEEYNKNHKNTAENFSDVNDTKNKDDTKDNNLNNKKDIEKTNDSIKDDDKEKSLDENSVKSNDENDEAEASKDILESNSDNKIDNDNKDLTINNDEKKDSQNQEENDQNNLDNNVKVFKVDKTKMLVMMSYTDKLKLLKISQKLSSTDAAQIKALIKGKNENDASIEIFAILKKRLSGDDYEEMKEILSPYMRVNYIEKSIS